MPHNFTATEYLVMTVTCTVMLFDDEFAPHSPPRHFEVERPSLLSRPLLKPRPLHLPAARHSAFAFTAAFTAMPAPVAAGWS